MKPKWKFPGEMISMKIEKIMEFLMSNVSLCLNFLWSIHMTVIDHLIIICMLGDYTYSIIVSSTCVKFTKF